MLLELHLKNFKSVSLANVPFGTVNILIGLNGSGKTSLVQSLALLKQSLGGQNLNLSGSLVNLGSFADVMSRKAPEGDDLELGVRGSVSLPEWTQGFRIESLRVTHTVAFSPAQLTRLFTKYQMDDTECVAEWTPLRQKIEPNTLSIGGGQFQLGLSLAIGKGLQVGSRLQTGQVKDVDFARASMAADLITQSPSTLLSRTFFVPALRGSEQPTYPLGDTPSADLTTSAGSFQQAQALATTLAYRRDLEEQIAGWMEEVTRRRMRTRLLPQKLVSLETTGDFGPVKMVNEGFGSNQLSYVLTQLALLPEDSSLAIEEPEIHLHPAAQASLVNLLVREILKRRNQLILTTHSEHVLYAVMRLIADGTLSPDTVNVFHVELAEGESRFQRLEIDSSGRSKGGLPGFFDAQVQEFRRFIEASERRP